MRRSFFFQRGFTIVELIVVVVVIAILATLVAVGYNGIQANARDKSLLSDIDGVESEVVRYATKHNGIYGSAVRWDSSVGSNANIQFTPSAGNIIVVSSREDGYCIRAYNPASNSKTLATAATKGSACAASWTQVATGGTHTCALDSDGTAYCWGSNSSGQLGNGTTDDSSTPVAVATTGALAGKSMLSLSLGASGYSCGLASDNQAYCWGSNSYGGIGSGSASSSEPQPVAVSRTGVLAGKTINSLSSGSGHSCAIASDNFGYCWGWNNNGQLGDGTTTNSSTPVPVARTGVLAGKTLKSISAGSGFTCAIASDNLAYCWGLNGWGQLGNSSTTSSLSPVAVSRTGVLAGKTMKSVVLGGEHACAVASDNYAYCWGGNASGKLGNGTTSANSTTATTVVRTGVLSGKTIRAISAAQSGGHVCVLASDNQAYCWGQNDRGQLGNNTTSSSSTSAPVTVYTAGVLAGKTLTGVSANGRHTCATTTDANLYCWGNNSDGRFGNGTLTSSSVPVLTLAP